MSEPLLLYILLSPLVGSVVNAFFGKRLTQRLVASIAVLAVLFAFVIAAFVGLLRTDSLYYLLVENWLPYGLEKDMPGAAISVSLYWDEITQLMVLLITGVGGLIHIYSVGYMEHDRHQQRYFVYLNLFVFFMLLLVLSNNLVTLFVGWEGVGLCSYLLIGFWFDKDVNAIAGKKAFLVNRVGDAGFILGMLLLLTQFGLLDVNPVGNSSVALKQMVTEPSFLITIATLLLFLGAVGKSAQFPLLVWLPDAMAGPTPVSALIHAATMVTAGIYMVVRLGFLFALAPWTMEIIAAVGLLTAFFAACAALGQKDIKRILAYSTVSQLGYMFLALGIGAMGAGMFHLISHGFYKALLFLGAGSVIHTLKGEQHIDRIGGLKNYMIPTTLCFIAGAAALIGFPYVTSGWYSKGAILHHCYVGGHYFYWLVGLLTAMLTTLYILRLFIKVFLGTPKIPKDDLQHLHESPLVMILPMAVLAVLSLVGGFSFLGIAAVANQEGGHALLPTLVEIGVITLALLLGWIIFREKPTKRSSRFTWLQRLGEDGFYLDALVTSFVGKRLTLTAAKFTQLFEGGLVEGALRLIDVSTRRFAYVCSLIQRTNVKAYMVTMYLGVLFVLWFVVWRH